MESLLGDLKHLDIQEPLQNRIRAILDEYPDGTQIARELLQNSDDAGSRVQWYLLDHRDHVKHAHSTHPTSDTKPLQLIHDDFHKYMGPALLAGNDTVFSDEDFVSLRNLASSGKLTDKTKIGQMGIGFNSIYHLTDCPSFITGDQFMVIDPHLNMFKNHTVRGHLKDLGRIPAQLKTFSVLEDIKCSERYQGTIFRFPLRTEEQVSGSEISDNAYTPAKMLEILEKLKEEALRALLFLKYVEEIIIYERKEDQDMPTRLFHIKIANAEEVRKRRLELLENVKKYLDSKHSASQVDPLEYYVRPTYRITQEDGSTTEETWHITTLVGNIAEACEHIKEHTGGNLDSHKLIPWVGIAAPADPNVKIDVSRLFCFLPMGIRLPFPVHINGHFAVKQSRREIWTNQDKDFSRHAAANIKSLWNDHLFKKHIPEAYAAFLQKVGLDHGPNYDLWPTACGEGIGLDSIWKDMLKDVLRVVLTQDHEVFHWGSKFMDNYSLCEFSKLYIAEHDIDPYPLLKEALHSMVSLAEEIPSVILKEMTALLSELDLEQIILTPAYVRDILSVKKKLWSSTADSATRMEMLKYCLLDNNIAELRDLPLLPLNGDIWVDFSKSEAQERFFVPRSVFEVLSPVTTGLVNLNMEDYPFEQINEIPENTKFWVPMSPSSIAQRVREAFQQHFYQNDTVPAGRVSQSHGRFPLDTWIMKFWDMTYEFPDCRNILSELAGIHLLPVVQNQLAPLSPQQRAIHLNTTKFGDVHVGIMEKACSILEQHLDCSVLRSWFRPPASLQQFVVDISDAPGILDLLTTKAGHFINISQVDRRHLATYFAMFLQPGDKVTKNQRRVLRRLPIYRRYNAIELEPLDAPETPILTPATMQRRLAHGYSHSEHPWTPQSVDLLADDQPMREHLRVILSVPVLSESEYWYTLVKTLAERSEGDWDAILTKLAPSYHVHSKTFDLGHILREFPFVLTQTASEIQAEDSPLSPACRLSPESVVHPTLAAYFQHKDSVFPAGVYGQAPLFGILSELGMHSTFDSAFVRERFEALFASGGPRMKENRKMVEALYSRLNSECSERFLKFGLRTVLVAVPWVYTGSGGGWCTPATCRPQKERELIGDKMPLAEFTFTNDALLGCMGWKTPPPLEMVLENLFSIIDKHHQHSADTDSVAKFGSSEQKKESSNIDSLDIRPIYQYLSDRIKDSMVLKDVKERLRNKPWILVSGAFYTVDRVALKMYCDLHPHFAQLPASNLDDFYLALDVREHVRQEDMEGILATIGSKYPDERPLSQEDADLVYRLLTAIAYGQNPKWSADLLLLTEDGGLKRAVDVVYDDVNVRQSDLGAEELPYTFVHRRISHEMADRLSIVMFSERCWQDNKDNSFDPFFQQENIVERIKGILNDYDPSSLFSEFLQNASDAGATECRFWLDSREFGTDKLLSKQMAAWQGPALMIYNDAEFSDKDFDALCKLGIGNKKEDNSKIGRHGLGFNSVYHFTDVPSIVSGPYIGFFDPHMTNLPKSRDRNGVLIAKGGHRCDFRKLSMESFADQLAPYKEFRECDMSSHFKGTLFRIPLRKPQTAPVLGSPVTGKSTAATFIGSGFGDSEWTVAKVRRMMERWVVDAKIGMLFLKNVKSIQIWDGSKPEVTVTKLETDKSSLFMLSNLSAPKLTDSTVLIKVSSNASSPSENADTSKWLICCDEDFPPNTPAKFRKLADKKHWSPHRGVAIKVEDTDLSEFRCKLFVHLPTSILTDLPFHIHGDFALTSSRKNLAGGKEEESEKRDWNSFLMETILPQTAIRALKHLFTRCFLGPSSPGRNRQGFNSATNDYFKHWPISATADFQPFLEAFLYQTYDSPVFPRPGSKTVFPMQLAAGRDAILPGPVTIPLELEAKIVPWLSERNRAVCIVPDPVISAIKARWSRSKKPKLLSKEVDGDCIRGRLSETVDYIKNNMTTRAEREWILGWAFQPVLYPTVRASVSTDRLQIVPLLNGEWKQLVIGKAIYYVATEQERNLLSAEDILVDEDVFSNEELKKALDVLVKGEKHNVRRLPVEVFASTFLKEHPDEVTDKQLRLLWDYIEEKCTELDPFYEFPILKTSYGTMTTLGEARTGFQISGLPHQMAQRIIVFTELLRDLDIVVYERKAHRNHQFFKDKCLAYSDLRLLKVITTHWNDLRTYRSFSSMEAKGMRELILACSGTISHSLWLSVGQLPVWTAQGSTDVSPLIAANEAYYLEGHFGLEKLGEFPNVLHSVDARIFKPMGATPLKVTVALTNFLLPKFHNGLLKCDGEVRTAYLALLSNLFIVSRLQGEFADVARVVVRTARCYVARDGSFHTLKELFVPSEALTEMMFADRPDVFADKEMALLMTRFSMQSNLRSLNSNPKLVVECAEKVLAETVDTTADWTTTRMRAVQLIKYIYKNPEAGGVDWMDAKWKFVPRETNLEFPYDLMAPKLPLYMAFSELVGFSNREATWTQCGFFPVELQPSDVFKVQFPKVCAANVTLPVVFKHLNVLVKDIAPKSKSTPEQLRLKATVFKIYGIIEQYVGHSDVYREFAVEQARAFLKIPYILNGHHKDSSKKSSWFRPERLMFGIVNNVPPHFAVDPVLHQYRNFLLAAGAAEIETPECVIEVEDGRTRGDMEDRMMNCFETQDQEISFMDVRFKFQKGSDILAHKFVLATASEYFLWMFKCTWASNSTWDHRSGVQVVDLSTYGDIRTGFWGLLYYFYSDSLIQSNGPPRSDEDNPELVNDGEGSDGTFSQGEDDSSATDDDDIEVHALEYKLSERLQYLMELQDVANRFKATRLKDLIAQELVMGQKVVHSNVFMIRDHAERNEAENVRKHCNEFIEKNKASVMRHIERETGLLRTSLKERLQELESNWRELVMEP
ncbi:hypothetical protein BGZ47_011508 [Haplosporangium gracile]|nr:hypothetical protein BGZ47_011508 [Haplosporangium gracile]